MWDEGADVLASRLNIFGQQLVLAWRAFAVSPMTALLTVSIVVLVLSLLGGFLLLVQSVDTALTSSHNKIQLSIYLKDNSALEQVNALVTEVTALPEVESVVVLSSKENFARFRESLGSEAAILDGLEAEDPLPASIEINFKDEAYSEDMFRSYEGRYRSNPIVELTHYNRGLLGRLGQIVESFKIASLCSILFIGFIASILIACAIQLALYSHKEEIEIMRLVGATDAFVRTPYVIEGFFQGVLGAVLSIGVVYFIVTIIRGLAEQDPFLKVVVGSLSFLSLKAIALLMLAGVVIGVLGSWITVRRFIVSYERL